MIAEVILNSNAKQLNKVFDYKIPDELAPKIKLGARVLVPFSNRKELDEGFVVNIKETSEYKVKEISGVNGNYLDEKSIKLANWMAKRYFCNISDCIKLMLPPGTTAKVVENRVKEKNANFQTMIPRELFEEINVFLTEKGMTKVEFIKKAYEIMKKEG